MIRWHYFPPLAAVLLAACASAPPLTEVRLVAKAFEDLDAASAPLLDDLAVAERAQGRSNAQERARNHSGGSPAAAPAAATTSTAAATAAAVTDRCPHVLEVTGAGGASVQRGYCLDDSYYYSELADPPATAAFRRSLAAVGDYTEVLVILAEGRNIEAAQAQLQSLAGNVGSTLELAGATGIGTALSGFSAALQPVVALAAKRANARELARNVKDVAPQALAVIEQLRNTAPTLFNTLTDQSLRGFQRVSEDAAKVRAGRIETYRGAIANYVVLLDQYRQLLTQLVASYDENGRPTLAGLAERSAQLSAQADTWRRTFTALRRGTD